MALRDVVSYLITATDQTKGAVQSAKANMEGLRGSFVGVSTSMRALGAAGGIAAFAVVAKQAFDAGKAVADVRIEMERIRNTLGQGVGMANVTNEMTFLRKTADEFGLSFNEVSLSYARFTAATRGSAIEGQATKDLFLAMSKASTALGLSTDATAGALRAFQQMVSKGTVASEELKGQLAEHLPGAFQIAARSMGVTTAELVKMLEKGEVLATDLIPKMTRQMSEEFGPAAEKAMKGTAAEVNRLSNEWQRLKEITATGFVGDLTMSAIALLATYLKDLNRDLFAVSIGMRNFLGLSTSALSSAEVDKVAGALQNDPMSLGERRLQWTEPPKPPKPGPRVVSDAERKKAESEAAKRAREEYERSKEELQADREKIKQTGITETSAIAREQQLLQARYSAGMQTEAEYYEQRLRLIDETQMAERTTLAADSARMTAFKANAKDRIDLDRQIATNAAESARIEADALNDMIEKNIEYHGILKARAAATKEARAAQQEMLDASGRQQNAEVEGMGLGQQERQRRAGRNEVENRYGQMRQQLESQKTSGAFDKNPALYQEELDRITEFQGKALSQYDAYYSALRAKHQDGFAGAREAMADYVTASQDSFSQVYGLMNTTFQSMGDVVAEFATTGEFSMRKFGESVRAELARIATNRLLGMLVGAMMGGGTSRLGGSYTAGGAGFGSQNDFPMAAGTNYVPRDGFRATLHEGEAVVPKAFNPAAGGVGGGTVQFNQNVYFGGGGGQGQYDQAQMAEMVGRVAVAKVSEAQQRAGR